MKSGKGLKIFSIILTLLGLGTSLASSWVEDQKMEEVVSRKVREALPQPKEES